MNEPREIILTTEETGELGSACVWDPKTGIALMSYIGADVAGSHSVCFLGNDYLLMSDKTKPVLNAWPLNSQYPVTSVKFGCTGIVNAMAVTGDGFYCVTAVGTNLSVWQIASGRQLAEVTRHYLPVTCIKFTDDGSHFISGGDDGQAFVWPLAYLVSVYSKEFFPEQKEPRYSFSDHTLPIRDLYVGHGGMRAHFVTVSLDKSCRLYDLSCGQLLAKILFDNVLCAVTMNPFESMIFVGTVNGNIFQLDMGAAPRTREHHVKDDEKGKVFVGHSNYVSCLSVSHNGRFLLSGSHDRKVILWNISSRKSIRTIEHTGSITNAFFAMAPKQMFSKDFKPVLVLSTFQRMSNENEGNLIVQVRTTEDHWYEDSDDVTADADNSKLKEKLRQIAGMNTGLYNFGLEKRFKILHRSAENGPNEEERMEAED